MRPGRRAGDRGTWAWSHYSATKIADVGRAPSRPAPKGALDAMGLPASLKRCPDTNQGLSPPRLRQGRIVGTASKQDETITRRFNDSMAQSQRLAGLRSLLDDSLLLVADPSLYGILALAKTLAVRGAAAGVGGNVGGCCGDYVSLAAGRTLFRPVDLDSRRSSF